MLVFPAVDIRKGRCVRLLQGRPDDETVYYEQPWRAALHWQELGAQALHVVDLDGALGTGRNLGALIEIIDRISIPTQVGGGLREETLVKEMLDSGAARAVVGTRAVAEPEWLFGLCRAYPDRVVVALDARDGKVAVEGWRQNSELTVLEAAQRLQEGPPAAFLYTDVCRDGMLTSPNFEGVEELVAVSPVPVIASGGVSSVEDVARLGDCGADAVIVGKAFYENKFGLADALEVASRHRGRLSAKPGHGEAAKG